MTSDRGDQKNDLLDKKRPAPVYLSVLEAEDAHAHWQQQRREEDELRLPLLFRRYGIAEGDWRGLALALARDYVAGFQYRKPNPAAGRDLYEAQRRVGWVEKMRRDGAVSDDQAFERLTGHGGPYESRYTDADAFKKQYQRDIRYLDEAGFSSDVQVLRDQCYQTLMWELDPIDPSEWADHIRKLQERGGYFGSPSGSD